MRAFRRYLLWSGALIALSTLWLAGCAAQGLMVAPKPTPAAPSPIAQQAPSPTPTPGPLSLLLLHTNDTAGELEPCG